MRGFHDFLNYTKTIIEAILLTFGIIELLENLKRCEYMDLMQHYKLLDDIGTISMTQENAIVKLLSQDLMRVCPSGNDMIHSINESLVVISWRTRPDSKVVISLDFNPPIIEDFGDLESSGMTHIHRHDFIEMAYVVKGELSQLIAGNKYTFPQGSICIIDRNSEHADFVKDQDNYVIFLEMKEDLFDELFLSELDNKVQKFIRKALLEQKSTKQFIQFTPQCQSNGIFPLIERIANEKFNKRKGAKYIIKGLMIRVFDILTKDYTMLLNSTHLKEMNELLFLEVERYLRENYKDASLKELTMRFHFQQDYYARLIKKHTSMTFSEFHRKIRMSKAEELLLNTSMSIGSIVEAVGYENRQYFYKLFYDIHKMTPTQYRKKHGTRSYSESE